MNAILRIPLLFLGFFGVAATLLVAVVTGGYLYVEPSLPAAAELRDIKFQIPLRVYSRDGRVIAEFGEQKRTPVPYEQIPEVMIQAILAAEDDTFFDHPGLDFTGTARAIVNFLGTGGDRVAGGSTITQQVARENFLTRDVTLVRKFKEWILAFRIEREFTKREILALYLNTYFFGQQSYGVAAAAQTYFNKDLEDISLSDAAILAGIPQGPSIMNPYRSPENAASRRAYVLRRLYELRQINDDELNAAMAEPIVAQRFGQQTEVEADYVAEMVRAELIRRLGSAAYTDGLKVTTTIDSRLQTAANGALRTTLVGYDERHGYRGPIANIEIETAGVIAADGEPDQARIQELLADYPDVVGFESAFVVAVDDEGAEVFLRGTGRARIDLSAVEWASRYISEQQTGPDPTTVGDVLSPGDIVRIRRLEDGNLRLAQLPAVQGAFVSLDPQDGAVVALAGGFDYFLNNYNRATQSLRQPGSAFKPFVYSAALEHGYTTATIINDAPIVFESAELETVWKPSNYSGRSHGEVPMRRALKESMNQAAVRTLRNVGITNTIRHLRNFGFDENALPANASLALGAGGIAPVNLASSYAVLANGGYAVKPYFIQRIEDANGEVLYDSSRSVAVVCRRSELEVTETCDPEVAPADTIDQEPQLVTNKSELYPILRRAPRVVAPQNIYLITDVLRDVIRSGSGARAGREMSRRDIAGKTGTTNDAVDAWFAGFNADVVGVAWVGFDDGRPLGNREQGGVTAIPMWISYMNEALDGNPEHALEQPTGIVEMRVNPENGLVASNSNPGAIWEKFRVDNVPPREPEGVFSSFPPLFDQQEDGQTLADEPPIF